MTTMDYSATLRALKMLKVETGSLVCLGCDYQDVCSTHGCAILRNAMEHMVDLDRALRSSEKSRSEIGRRLAAAQKELHEVRSELYAALEDIKEMLTDDYGRRRRERGETNET